MKKILGAGLLIIIAADVSAGKLFPDLKNCSERIASVDCDLVLSDSGALSDRKDLGSLSIAPDLSGVMESVQLYKTKQGYIFEKYNYSASKSRLWILLKYSGQDIVVDRIYKFSLRVNELNGPKWYGYECRGQHKSIPRKSYLPFSQLAESFSCGEDFDSGLSEITSRTLADHDGLGLKLSIPVFGGASTNPSASYLFLDDESPDIMTMLCVAGCNISHSATELRFFGRIGNSSRVTATFSTVGYDARGVYRYADSASDIVIAGVVNKSKINLVEHEVSSNEIRADFVGVPDGDGYKGKWISRRRDEKQFLFSIYPSLIY